MRIRIIQSKIPNGYREIDITRCSRIYDRCHICNSKLYRFTELHGSGHHLKRGICYKCGITSLITIPDMRGFYETEWDSLSEKDIVARCKAPYTELIRTLKPLLSHKDRILDFGCGYGGAMKRFQEFGYNNIEGIEISKKRWEHCRENNLSVNTKANGKFDAIYSWHVFEHIQDINKQMQQFHDMLNNYGYLFLAVPELEQENIFHQAHFIPHIHCFSDKSLVKLSEKHGFNVKYIKKGILLAQKCPVVKQKIKKHTLTYPALRKFNQEQIYEFNMSVPISDSARPVTIIDKLLLKNKKLSDKCYTSHGVFRLVWEIDEDNCYNFMYDKVKGWVK